MTWRERERQNGSWSANFLPDPEAGLAGAGDPAACLEAEGLTGERAAALLRDLHRLSAATALGTLDGLGWQPRPGVRVSAASLRRPLRVLAQHEPLLRRLLGLLAGAGVLTADPAAPSRWTVAEDRDGDAELRHPEQLAAELMERHPWGRYELGLLRRCGERLADVLRGRADPLGLLFGDGDFTAADLYWKSPLMRTANLMVRRVVSAAIAQAPESRPIRVLEIGAGTGATTAAVLEALEGRRCRYVFTDLSAVFFSQAESRFAGTEATLDFRVLDIERSPRRQGFDRHGYDLVVAANVLHATRDLGVALRHCREVLAPDGQVLLSEFFQGQAWLDLTFGLSEGWWRFDDAYRVEGPLASPSVWKRAARKAGLAAVATRGVVAGESADASEVQGILLARGPRDIEEASGTWVVMPDAGGVARGLAAALAARKQTVVWAEAEGSSLVPEASGLARRRLEPGRREDWRTLLNDLPGDAPLRGAVHLAALDGHGASASVAEMAHDLAHAGSSALALTQGLLDAGTRLSSGLWFVTRGAQVVEGEPGGELAGAALWGLGRTIAVELPELKPHRVDLDPRPVHPEGSALAEQLAEELLYSDGEEEVAFRGGARSVPRLVECVGAVGRAPPQPDRTVLVTGGLGGLGLEASEWLADQGVSALVLTGTEAPGVDTERRLEGLRARGVTVRVELGEGTDEAAVKALLARLDAELPPLGGVLHAAENRLDGALEDQSWDRFERVLRPQLLGAWCLHRRTEERELERFVLFSGTAGTVGIPGQSSQAAVSSFLDQLARHRHALGIPGQSIAWAKPLEHGPGEAPGPGAPPLDPVLRDGRTVPLLVEMDGRALAARYRSPPRLLEDLLPTGAAAAPAAASSEFLSRLCDTPPAEREALLVSFLQDELQAVLHESERPDPDAGFFDLGLDSLMAVELQNRVNRALAGIHAAPSSMAFDYPDTRRLARYLMGKLVLPDGGAEASSRADAPVDEIEGEKGRIAQLSEEGLLAEIMAKLDRRIS